MGSSTRCAQILATEDCNCSLLATRGITRNELFSRATMFGTVLSAAAVVLALVAQATVFFGSSFRLVAVLMLPVVPLVGPATVLRVSDAKSEDCGVVVGMNRLRHAYLEPAPELEPYFVTAHHEDMASIRRTYGWDARLRISRILAGRPRWSAPSTS